MGNARRHEKDSAVGHGIAGIHNQVCEDTIDLPHVGQDLRQAVLDLQVQVNVIRQRWQNVVCGVADILRQVGRQQARIRSAGEGQKLLHHIAASVDSLFHLLCQLYHLVGIPRLHGHEGQAEAQNLQQVSHVMGETAGQKPDRLEFPRLAQLLLHRAADFS